MDAANIREALEKYYSSDDSYEGHIKHQETIRALLDSGFIEAAMRFGEAEWREKIEAIAGEMIRTPAVTGVDQHEVIFELMAHRQNWAKRLREIASQG